MNEDDVRNYFIKIRKEFSTRQVQNYSPLILPKRLWQYLVHKSGIEEKTQWANMSKEKFRSLVNLIIRDEYRVQGKTTFKEEFVTCGGVSLDDIDLKTMESKKVRDMHFAGEVLNIDAVTGGFNFQAAWSTGFLAGTAMASHD